MRELLEVADVVLEGFRPAALMRRGLGPDRIAHRPGRVWLRATAYGTDGQDADRLGFGDDTAVAGGLVGVGDAGPVFVGFVPTATTTPGGAASVPASGAVVASITRNTSLRPSSCVGILAGGGCEMAPRPPFPPV